MADDVEAMGMDPLVQSMGPHLFVPRADDETVARVRTMMTLNNPVGVAAALRGRAAWESRA